MSVAFLELIALFSLRTFAPGESPEFQHFPSLCLFHYLFNAVPRYNFSKYCQF